MTVEDVIEVLERLETLGLWYCIEGGWGVDALVGEQTREHSDLDLGVRLEEVDRLVVALGDFDRDDREWPSSLVLRDARGRRVDAHPLTFDENGDGWQANLCGDAHRWPREHIDARSRIGGREVRCITPELQLRWHAHEGFDDVDWQDMRTLGQRFGFEDPGKRPGFIASRRTMG